MNKPQLTLQRTIPLLHSGDCALIGLNDEGYIAVEELYDDWYAQHIFDRDGILFASSDENSGQNPDANLLPNLELFTAPSPVNQAARLNYTAGRLRGLRELDRIVDTLQPLSVPEKIALNNYAVPGTLLGIVESYVLAEAAFNSDLSLICRRVRIAYTVTLAHASDRLPFDYDSYTLYLTQWFNLVHDDLPLNHGIVSLGNRPMDLLLAGDLLYVADAGDQNKAQNSALHIYRIG